MELAGPTVFPVKLMFSKSLTWQLLAPLKLDTSSANPAGRVAQEWSTSALVSHGVEACRARLEPA
jgi:hypothetical protein